MFDLHEKTAPTTSAQAELLPVEDKRAGLPVDPGRILTALYRGRRTLAIVGAVGLVAGVVLAKTVVPREYTTSSTILWEPERTPLTETRQDPRELRTLVDSVKVPGNIAETRKRLALSASVATIGSKINVTSSDKSNVVSIAATWDEPETAAHIANTIVDVFLERRLSSSRERYDALLKTVTEDADSARKALADTRRAYDAFREEHGIADLPIETQAAIEQAAKLRADADSARAEAAGEEARANSLLAAAKREPSTTILSRTETSPQAVKLAETQAELAGARATLSPEHPKVLALAAQSEGLRGGASQPTSTVVAERVLGRNPQLDVIQQILAGSAAQREAALRRESKLTELAALAAERITKLSVVEGRASELLASVRVAESHLADLEKLRVRAADVVRNPAPGFRVVDEAIRPEIPSKSHRRLFAIASPIVALFLAASYLIARALRGLGVQTARELAFWGKGPVIASSRWPVDPNGRRDLTVDLWAYAVQMHGKTLVVAMSSHERDLTEMIASGLNPPEVAMADEPLHADAATILWDGAEHGPELRRASRLADRVLVVVKAGMHSAAALAEVHDRLGRTSGVAYILLGVGSDVAKLPDRAGDIGRFFRGGSPEIGTGSYEVSHA